MFFNTFLFCLKGYSETLKMLNLKYFSSYISYIHEYLLILNIKIYIVILTIHRRKYIVL